MAGRRKVAWRKPLLLGGIVLLVSVGGSAILVFVTWPRLSALYREAAIFFAEMRSVQTAVQQKFQTPAVSVLAERSTAVPGTVLSITLINPPFLENIDVGGRAGSEKALEVATAARDALPCGRGYGHYQIAFERRRGVGVTIATGRVFRIAATSLPPPSAR